MLVIRFRRSGKKSKPTYRIVVAEHSWPVNGKFNADLGFYNPHTKQTGLNKPEVEAWLGKGAKPSNSVGRVLLKEKIKHPSIVVVTKHKKAKKAVEEVATKQENSVAQDQPTETPVVETAEATEAVELTEPSAPTE